MYVPFADRGRHQDDFKGAPGNREEKLDDNEASLLAIRATTLKAELERILRLQQNDDFLRRQRDALDKFHPPARSELPARNLLPEFGPRNHQGFLHPNDRSELPAHNLLPEFKPRNLQGSPSERQLPSPSSLLNPLMSPAHAPSPSQQGKFPASPSGIHLNQQSAHPNPSLDMAMMAISTSLVSAFDRVAESPAQAGEVARLKVVGATAFTEKFAGATYLMTLENLKKSTPGNPDNYYIPTRLLAGLNPPPSGSTVASVLSTRSDKIVTKLEWNTAVTSILTANFSLGSTDVSAIYDRPTVVTSTGESIEDYSNRFHQASAVCCWAALLSFPDSDYRTMHFRNGPPTVHLQCYIQGLPPSVRSKVQLAILANGELLSDYTKLRRFTVETAKDTAPSGFQPLPPPLPYASADPAMIAMEGVICYHCNQPGHYANACPSGDTGNKGSYGKGKGYGTGGRGKGKGYGNPPSDVPCRNFANGTCNRGDTCRFTHVDGHARPSHNSPNPRRYDRDADNNSGNHRYTGNRNYHQRDGDHNANNKRNRARSSSRDREVRSPATKAPGSLNG
jgi:hypothetical protein